MIALTTFADIVHIPDYAYIFYLPRHIRTIQSLKGLSLRRRSKSKPSTGRNVSACRPAPKNRIIPQKQKKRSDLSERFPYNIYRLVDDTPKNLYLTAAQHNRAQGEQATDECIGAGLGDHVQHHGVP